MATRRRATRLGYTPHSTYAIRHDYEGAMGGGLPVLGREAMTALGLLTLFAGVWLTVRFYVDPHVPRLWRRATAIVGMIAGLACALVWYQRGDGDFVLGFPLPSMTATLDDVLDDPARAAIVSPVERMLHATTATAVLAFANFVAGVGAVHLVSRRTWLLLATLLPDRARPE